MLERVFQITKSHPNEAETLRHNLTAHIFDGVLFAFAMSFVSVQTVLPVFVERLGGGTVAIGSIAVLWTLGFNLPQILFLPFTHRAGPALPVMLRYALLYRLSFGVLGVFTWFFVGRILLPYTIIIVLTLITMTAISGSLGVSSWFQIFTMTIPVTIRGRLLALRQMLGSGLGIIAGSIVAIVLSQMDAPKSFAILFFIAFAVSMASYVFLRRLKESHEIDAGEVHLPMHMWRRCVAILRENRNFRNYLYADGLMLMGMTASAFYAVYGLKKFGLPVSAAGTFTAVTMASMVIANVVFGYLGDHYGHKLNLICLALAVAFASLVAVLSQSAFLYWGVFFFMACTLALQGISRLPLVAEMCVENERPLYVAITNTVTAPAVFIGLFAGAMINVAGYEAVLIGYSLLGFLAALLLWKRVEEPRELGMRNEYGWNLRHISDS